MERSEQKAVLDYLVHVIKASGRSPQVIGCLGTWAGECGELAGIPSCGDLSDLPARRGRVPPDRWRDLEQAVVLRHAALQRVAPGRTEQILQSAGRELGFSALEIAIFGLMVRYYLNEAVERLWDALNRTFKHGPRLCLNARLMAWMLGTRETDIARCLEPDGPLLSSGLILVDSDGDLQILHRFSKVFTAPGRRTDLRSLLLSRPLAASLDWADFDHLGADRDHIARLAEGALHHRQRGVNILIYGPPGTGKTEFCKTVAAQIKQPLFPVGETDEDGEEPQRGQRLGELRLAQRLLGGGRSSLLLFDEMEDLLGEGPMPTLGRRLRFGAAEGSKVFLHRLLEATPVPTFWTTNSLESLSGAVIRRMTFALEMGVPPGPVRHRMWRRALDRHGWSLPDPEVQRLAKTFQAPPALASAAVTSVRQFGGGVDDLHRSVAGLSKALNGGVPAEPCPEATAAFEIALVEADEDLEALTGRIAGLGRDKPLSFLLSGPPGTGKSAYARHLAERLGMEPLIRRASDLLSAFVGETEKSIASAFSEARQRGAFLVFDEVDSLIRDRRDAVRGWEVSQVNEMLTWMENHPLPYACTTNRVEDLDWAAARRFLFKVRFAYLTPARAATAFQHFFDLPAPPRLGELTNLTPADFAIVRRRIDLVGEPRTAERLLDLLGREAAAKPDHGTPLGFRTV